MGIQFIAKDKISKTVKIWLCIGIVLVFVQVVVGGITRLTGSGLSITKWEIVTGTLPPLNAAQWDSEFDLYKETPQYQKINEGMSMSQFKFIYFWEYFHRLWARTMGFVFLFPFLYFLFKGKLSRSVVKDLSVVILLTVFVASLGWIMVASGLINRPWVNAYKLTFHLCSALTMFSYLLWTTFKVFSPKRSVINNSVLVTGSRVFLFVLALQIFLGGIMSGMKAGLFYPTWPDMNGVYLPEALLTAENWNVDNFVFYDDNNFMPAFIQFAHRGTAYILIIIGLGMFFKLYNSNIPTVYRRNIYMLITMLVIQAIIGILTVVSCKGSIPVGLGVMHQAGALVLLGITLLLVYRTPKSSY
ncbi:MAG: COX15/CtaA family protein [Saprospiraceae bacterium]